MDVLELWLIFIFLLVFSSRVQVSNSQSLTCNSNDLKALESFLIGLDTGTFNDWGSSNPSSTNLNCCTWLGITCNSSSSLGFLNDPIDSGRVVKLELSGKRLMGKLNQTTFTGLDQLTTLNLSINFLGGSLPPSLFQLPNLQVIDLSKNDFSGSIPISINLPVLEFFDISDNSFENSVPVGICINSTRIQIIDFSVNHFFGRIPSGFGNCSSLEHLWLGENFLAGDIQEDLFRLPRLNQLGLRDNRFSGQLSSGIGKLKLNVDGCSKGDPGQAGYGGLLRDETGIWIWGFYGKLGHCTSLEAELWAIYRGLTILFQKGTKGVEIESDSELAIDQIQNGPNTHSPYKALIEDARFLLKRCDCLLRHTLREGNRCADKLASLGVEQGEYVVLLEDPPEEVKNLVIADMTGVSVLRD